MRIAVIGFGRMGRNHARVLRELGQSVVTVDTAGHADHKGIVGLEADGACIAVPPDLLAEVALRCPIEPWLIEKPLATNLKDAQAVADQFDCAVGYVERHNPAVLALAENLDRVGRIIHVEAKRLGPAGRCDTSPALDLATHDLDVLRFLNLKPQPVIGIHRGSHLSALLNVGSLEASHNHPFKQRTLEILGTDGLLRLDYAAQTLILEADGASFNLTPLTEEPLRRMWQAILNDEPTATVADGIATLSLALELQAAPQTLVSPQTQADNLEDGLLSRLRYAEAA